ncbi:MAG: hypothetical protein MJ214_04555 [Bacilli bacterium]|nr:hypothetical protein [Bacilli bacterium]
MKKHILLILRTLISNNACVEAARTKEKKYTIVAIVFVLFSLFFAALPTCVTGFQQNGGAWLRGINYSFDTAMIEFGRKTTELEITFELKKDHTLVANNWESIGIYSEKHNELNCFISTKTDQETREEYRIMEIFYCDENKYDFNLYVEEISKNINPLRINKDTKNDDEKKPETWLQTEKDKDGNDVKKSRQCSFIVFGTNHVQGALISPGGAAGIAGPYGDYQHTDPNPDFIHGVLVKSENPKTILEDCASFFDQAFINTRASNTWRSTGIILGVDAGVILLMGFMVWVLTRGKNNPFRIYTFWDGQKIAYYACLTPGIISLFGFLMSNMAMMLFILAIGMRVMWLSMRTLRYQAPAK